MANTVVVMDGFENFAATTRFASYIPSASYATTTTGHEGGAGLYLGAQSSNWALGKQVPVATLNTTWFTAAFMYKRPGTNNPGGASNLQAGFGNTGSSQAVANCRMGLYIAGDGTIGVRKDGTTYSTTAAGVISADTWYHIEYRHRYGNATYGNFEVRVNGASVLIGAGDNSGVVLSSSAYATLGGGPGSTGSAGHIFDDLIIAQSNDATPAWFGISKVRHLPPTSTPTGQWLGSDSDSMDNHLLVDDINAASADWVTSTAGSAQRDLYGHAAASTGAIVYAVQMRAAAGLDVIGTDDFSLLVKSGATEIALRKTLGTGTPVFFESAIHNIDPATGAAWTKTAFDAVLFGVKS